MGRPVTEILDLFRVRHRITGIAFVACIVPRSCIAQAHAVCKRSRVDGRAASESSVARAAKLSVPTHRLGHPELDFDIGVGGRLQRGVDSAARTKIAKRLPAAANNGRAQAACSDSLS